MVTNVPDMIEDWMICQIDGCFNLIVSIRDSLCSMHKSRKYTNKSEEIECKECGDVVSRKVLSKEFKCCTSCELLIKNYGLMIPANLWLYNISRVTYIKMLLDQNFVCKICLSPPKNRKLHVDHDHNCCDIGSCGKCVRGLLCVHCNTFIGRYERRKELFPLVLNYIENKGDILKNEGGDNNSLCQSAHSFHA